jgi:hypothetical protein
VKIDRTQLISDLAGFATAGNGVVVGHPGAGKTYAVTELLKKLKTDGVLHLYLPVERLGAGTAAELANFFGREGDFVELLRAAVAEATTPAVVVFDGFDAARGEAERTGVFRLILRAVNELAGIWRIIVSVRTFDATKSLRLLNLFPDRDPGSGDARGCRQFIVPALTTGEVSQTFGQIPGLRELHEAGSADFRDLLTIPFNLWLIEQVIRAGADAKEFSQVTSEVQLLEIYWNYRVRRGNKPEDREFILRKAAAEMVERHTLTVRRSSVYEPAVREAWEGLLSDEILVEVAEQEPGVSFTHNILFDFAVSAHLLDVAPAKLATFVAEEPARPLFLRPSLVYHFTRLWHFDHQGFWRNFWSVVQREEVHLRQIIRLVLPAVVVNEAHLPADLAPLVAELGRGTPAGVDATAFLVQALRVLGSKKVSLWTCFLREISRHLDRKFGWDAGLIATSYLEAVAGPGDEGFACCGETGRRLLTWAWGSRKDARFGQWFERMAGLVAVPLVAKTYQSNANESRALLEAVLNVVGEPDFPIDCIFRLVHEIKPLIQHDPELVGLIYERVFGFVETNDAKTNIGGPVLPLISNRRQDYESCRYALIQDFGRFLKAAPGYAIPAGLRAVQVHAIQDHVLRHLRAGKTLRDITVPFKFRKGTAHYMTDGSAVWDESSFPDQELALADELISWLKRAAHAGDDNGVSLFLAAFASEAQAAFLWARLLVAAADEPGFMAKYVWELAVAEPVVKGSDTLVSLGAFLERSYAFLSHAQRIAVERAIMRLPQKQTGDSKALIERRRNRLVARLPVEHIVTTATAALRATLEKKAELPPNAPLFSVTTTSERYTEEMMLRDQGVAVDSAPNTEVRNLYRPLKEWNEGKKDAAGIEELLPTAAALSELLAKPHAASPAVLSTAATHLASFASNAIQKTRETGSEKFRLLRQLMLAAADSPEPRANPDHDAKWNFAAWSPAPRIEAAQALPWLTHLGEDGEAVAAITKLARDPVPSVRFLLASEIWRLHERYSVPMWALIEEMAATEKNAVVLQGVTRTLWALRDLDPERTLIALRKLLSPEGAEPDDDEAAQSGLVSMAVDFAVRYDNSWAQSALAAWRKKPVEFAASLAVSGRRLIEYLKPQHAEMGFERARAQVIEHLGAAADGLRQLQRNEAKLPQDIVQKKWRSLYSVIDNSVMRLYFAADVDPQMRQRGQHPMSNKEREEYFHSVLPILRKVLSFGLEADTGMLFAPTAHYFMQLLNGVVRYDPALVLTLAADVVGCSRRFNYNLDSFAMKETVRLVETLLADHRAQIQDEDSIRALLGLLDAFVEAGWPDALQLVWRLDEIYR